MCFAIPRGVSPGWSPRVPALTAFCARSVCSLSRLPRPAPPRSEFEEGSRGGQSFVDRPLCGARWERLVSGGRWRGKGRAHARVCGTPLTPRVVAGRGVLEGRRWVPGPTRLPVSPVPSVACASLPRASTSRPLSRRGRVVCGACRVLSGESGCRLVPPPSTAAFPRPVESREPSSPPPRGSGGSVTRGVGLALGGGLFLGERRSAASGASSDVGTRSAAAAASRAVSGGLRAGGKSPREVDRREA